MTPSDLSELAVLYCNCFAEPPWCEVFTLEEAEQEFQEIQSLKDAVLLVAKYGQRVVGAVVGFALSEKQDVAALLPTERNAFYLAEIFVAKPFRRQHVARQLSGLLCAEGRARGYARLVLRTSVRQQVILDMYAQQGFSVVAEQGVESIKEVNGVAASAPDQRVILAGSIV